MCVHHWPHRAQAGASPPRSRRPPSPATQSISRRLNGTLPLLHSNGLNKHLPLLANSRIQKIKRHSTTTKHSRIKWIKRHSTTTKKGEDLLLPFLSYAPLYFNSPYRGNLRKCVHRGLGTDIKTGGWERRYLSGAKRGRTALSQSHD